MELLFGLGALFLVFVILVIIFVLKFYKQKTKQSQTEKYLSSLGVNVSQTKRVIQDTVRTDFNTSCTQRPPCGEGYMEQKNSKGETCCYVDPSKTVPSKSEQTRKMLKEVSQELIITEGTELIVGTVLPKLYKAAKNPAAAAKAVKTAAIAAKAAMKVFIQNGVKTAVKVAATAPAKAAMGPVGWAMLVFDLVSMALDLYDPAGYQDFMSNEIAMNLRNIAEHNFQVLLENEGMETPALANFDYKNEIGQWEFTHVLPAVRKRMYDRVIENMPLELLDEAAFEDPVVQQAYIGDEAQKLLEAYMDSEEYKKEVCQTYNKQSRGKVKWVNGVGCSLTESECKQFNQYQSNAKDPNERQFALYTNRYRKKIGGSVKKPIVRTYPLTDKACVLSPLGWSKESCTSDKGRWDENEGMCSFSDRYCSRKGLKRHRMRNGVHNCIMFPGQKIAEMFFGTTITRQVMRTFDPESYKALLSGDLSLLKSWGEMIAFIALGPFGMALLIGLKMGGVDISKFATIDGNIKNIKTAGRAVGKAFEESYEIVEDSVKEYTALLEDGVMEMLTNVKKLAKISEKLGKDAAKQVAGMGKEGIDKVSDLVDRLPLGQVGDAINKGLGEVKKMWSSVFGWIPL